MGLMSVGGAIYAKEKNTIGGSLHMYTRLIYEDKEGAHSGSEYGGGEKRSNYIMVKPDASTIAVTALKECKVEGYYVLSASDDMSPVQIPLKKVRAGDVIIPKQYGHTSDLFLATITVR